MLAKYYQSSVLLSVFAAGSLLLITAFAIWYNFYTVVTAPHWGAILGAYILAAARNPQVNATWTDTEIQIKHFMNLGIAAATPRGLMVPNIKNAHELNLRELAIALNDLTARAREGKTQPAEMSNGTMTITNIGSLGIDTGTPIINPGEAAIIAFGTIKEKPWIVSGEVIPRWVTTLGGSFDHRILDGDLSARFLADVASILEEPALLLDM